MGFVPSTTNNELQIIMIMKISNDINKIALAVLGMSIWPMFLHLHLSIWERMFFSCSSSLSNISRLSGLSVNLADSFYLHCSPFPKSHFEFQSISIFFLCDFLFHWFYLGSFSYTCLSHIDNRLMSVSSCAEKSPKVHLMNSWCKARSDLFKSAGLDLRCQAS